mgnify:CR=1 FL=1
MMNSKLFTSASIGPLTLRNRTIRSAAFESMCPGNAPSRQLKDYHCSVAAGGVGMTTIAYAAVTQSGQLLHKVAFLSTGNCGCALKLYRD